MESSPLRAGGGRMATGLLPGLAAWAVGWAAMVWLDPRVDLANLAMVLLFTSAVATLWLPAVVSLAAGAVAVMVFNWLFVPPRATFTIDLQQHALLLGGMLVVAWMQTAVVVLQRLAADKARRMARRTEQSRRLGEALRDATQVPQRAGLLRDALVEWVGQPVHVLVTAEAAPDGDEPAPFVLGSPSDEETSGLRHCARQAVAFGPGTGRYEELVQWYLPLRGRGAAFGAAVMPAPGDSGAAAGLREQAQALCDQVGLALEREQGARAVESAREQAQAQSVRNAMLAAISHDYRTPLATILGAASSLLEQGERMDAPQRKRLAHAIADEATRLARLTDNTLELARLDAPGLKLTMDWESPEEIVGAVLTRARRHDPQRRVRARLEPDVPLVRCDALLAGQLLDNLVENALKYSESPAPVELLVRRQPGHVVFAVRDRGPGVPLAWRERIFDVFQRGAANAGEHDAAAPKSPKGAGVGLAVCRAIARAHQGELRVRNRAHGGASFEFWLPESSPPDFDEPVPQPAAEGAAR